MAEPCCEIRIPEGQHVAGRNAAGRVHIPPGEYVAQPLEPKVPLKGVRKVLRFLGADGHGRDVYVMT